VIIAAAPTNPMTVLRIVLTPLLLEKPQPYEGNSAVLVALPRAALGVRGGRPPRCYGTFCGGPESLSARQLPGRRFTA
jgi:hypothetical protein